MTAPTTAAPAAAAALRTRLLAVGLDLTPGQQAGLSFPRLVQRHQPAPRTAARPTERPVKPAPRLRC